MSKLKILRRLFLFAIIILFCYRGAQLQQCEIHNFSQSAPTELEVEQLLMQMAYHAPQPDFQLTAKQAEQVHTEVLKFNTQLAHYLYMVGEYIKNDTWNNEKLLKIEHEIAQLVKTTQALGIFMLIDQQAITEINKKILYLRQLATSREKR